MAAVIFRDFSYAYPQKGEALTGINLVINRGAFAVVAGPGGAGKTTLCMAVAGVVPHYFGGRMGGTVTVDRINILESSMSQLAMKVGTVLEDYESQLVAMTVEEEIAFGLETRDMPVDEIVQRVKAALEMTGLSGLEKSETSALSGGQKQRLAIAGALAVRPDILVLDEPSSALDPEGAASLYALLGDLNRQYGMTVIVVEHHLAKVLAYADQFILLSDGRLAKEGTPGEVLRFMWQQQIFYEAMPPLWQLKLSLEAANGVEFADWKNEEEAISELRRHLSRKETEADKSA